MQRAGPNRRGRLLWDRALTLTGQQAARPGGAPLFVLLLQRGSTECETHSVCKPVGPEAKGERKNCAADMCIKELHIGTDAAHLPICGHRLAHMLAVMLSLWHACRRNLPEPSEGVQYHRVDTNMLTGWYAADHRLTQQLCTHLMC